jgi:hypothetical protein
MTQVYRMWGREIIAYCGKYNVSWVKLHEVEISTFVIAFFMHTVLKAHVRPLLFFYPKFQTKFR